MLKFFTTIKDKIIGLFMLLTIGLLAILKWQKNSIKIKKEKIRVLKKEIELNKKLRENKEKNIKFEVRQKVKKEILEEELRDEKVSDHKIAKYSSTI